MTLTDYSWTNQKNEANEKITTFKPGDTGKSRVTATICLLGAEASMAIK